MNKMIHKKTRAFFLVVYVIYVSLVYTDSKKTASCLLQRHIVFATFGRQIKMPTCTHTGRFISVQERINDLFHYVLDNLNWLVFVFLSNNNQLDV